VDPRGTPATRARTVEFDDGGGLKNRRLGAGKMSISQILISRALNGCGEVAERLKAAVC
jgi:hypothetical protein